MAGQLPDDSTEPDARLRIAEAVDPVDPVVLPDERNAGGRGAVVTLTTVIALLVATALTVLGLGAADTAVGNVDASSWLWSSTKGEAGRVNAVTARVDTRAKITDAQNHEIQITQNDKYLILRDLETGQVTALDLTTLQVSAVMPTTPGRGVSVALHGDTAMVIDGVLGQVRQLNPRTLSPVGEPLQFPRGIVAGGFDGTGRLWIAVATEGTVVSIRPGTGGAGPKVDKTVSVTNPRHDLVLSALDSGVAVLDNTDARLHVVAEGVESVSLPISKPGVMPARTVGRPIVITVPADRLVILVQGQQVTRVTVPGSGPIGPAVAYSGRVYVPDPSSGRVREVSTSGQVTNDIPIPSPTGTVELEVREGYLFINSPDGPDARVVDNDHKVHDVNKYQDGVLGGDPPPPPPAPPPPPVNVPGAPQAVTATAGDGTATITWRRASDNGAPITRYVVEGHGQPITVGAEQRQIDVTGLTNGQTYRFSVYAVNAMGPGPRAYANPIIPTRDVPDPPASVTAVENPDGSVDISWPAADGQGHPIASYRVTSISGAGVVSPVGAVTGTSLQVVPGALAYGTQYAFTVIAINDLNAASVESPASNTVIPYTVPDAPLNLGAWTDPNQRGAIQLGWQAPASNGRPVTGYEVEEESGTITQVTGTTVTLAGYPDDTAVTVRVRALNLAGAGPDATASARTMAAPAITVTGQTQGYRDISITMTPNNGGGAATCTLTIGSGVVSAPCDTAPVTLTVGGLWPNNTYPFTVSITNPMGSASANGSHATNQLLARVVCGDQSYCGAGIYIYSTPSQANPGNAVGTFYGGNSFTPQCSIGGGNVNASPWGGKNTGVWLRLNYNGQTAYFPWAWATLDGGDNLGNIPVC